MNSKPIIFSTPMVKAILSGQKTMTRRVVKLKKGFTVGNIKFGSKIEEYIICDPDGGEVPMEFVSPYGLPGDHLWLRETHRFDEAYDGRPANGLKVPEGVAVECKAMPNAVMTEGNGHRELKYPGKWRPSIFMPRWASRITLEVTGVRVERLQDISHTDITAEGLGDNYTEIGWNYAFGQLWNSINGKKYPWSSNPFVWVISFKMINPEAPHVD
jgi:hypothetical protein